MNFRQRRMLFAVAAAMVAVLLWPPVNVQVTPTVTELEYVWLFSSFNGSTHALLLIAECVALALVGFITYRLLDEQE